MFRFTCIYWWRQLRGQSRYAPQQRELVVLPGVPLAGDTFLFSGGATLTFTQYAAVATTFSARLEPTEAGTCLVSSGLSIVVLYNS